MRRSMRTVFLSILIILLMITVVACIDSDTDGAETSDVSSDESQYDSSSEDTTKKPSKKDPVKGGDDDAGDETTTTPSGGEEPEPTKEMVDLSDYTVINSKSISSNKRTKITDMISAIDDITGVRLARTNDFTVKASASNKEILIGVTNRPESTELNSALENNLQYIIKQSENKVIICAGNEAALFQAMDRFVSLIETSGKLEIEKDFYYSGIYSPNDTFAAIINDYKLVYGSKNLYCESTLASNLASLMSEYSLNGYSANKDTELSESAKEVLIGGTNRQKSIDAMEGIDYYEYKIIVDDGDIILVAGGELALQWGYTELVKMINNDTLDLTQDSEKSKIFEMRNHFDFDTFTPKWINSHTPAAWLSNVNGNNFMEKAYALTSKTSGALNTGATRITSQVHRGDVVHYSEGSLESIASCIWMGVDVVEIDVQITKDRIFIWHHDTDLYDMTNADQYVGKPGYPSTYNISDWTYDQICDLRLLSGLGRNNPDGTFTVTDYMIPTAYEVFQLCAGRVFIQIDEKNNKNKMETLGWYNMAAAADAKECFITEHDVKADGTNGRGRSEDRHNRMLDTLDTWLSYDTTDTEFAEFMETLHDWTDENDALIRCEPYWPAPGNNYGSWIDHSCQVETNTTWNAMVELGYYHMWTENPLALIKYIEANCAKVNLPT